MIGGRKPHLGEVVAFARAEHDRADDLLGAVVPARLREEPQTRAGSVLDNVVPFVRPRSNDNARPAGPELAFPPAARPAPLTGRPFGITQRAGLIGLSMLVHGAVFAALAFWYIPAPLNGTELEAISVELVPPGSNTPAGQSPTPSENEGQAQAGQVTETPDEKPPVEQAEEPTTDQPQDVKVAEQEAAPEQPVTAEQAPQPAPTEPEPPREVVETPPEPRESIAMVESPNTPELATEKPPEVAPEKPVEPEKLTLLPQAPPPEEKPVEPPKPELQQPEPPKPQKPVEQKQPEPKKPEAKKQQAKEKPKAKEATRIAARTAERTVERSAGPQSFVGSNGTGMGAATRASYRGMVSAHLQRYKRYPPEAESRGERGRASVTFNVDGSGRVTSVRLAGGSGYASLDQEVQAMVRRASPFPAPPDGRGDSFTVPVNFGR